MKQIIETLDRENPLCILCEDCDIVCEKCPHQLSGTCISHDKVHQIDLNCLAEYGLSFGDVIVWSDLKNLAYERIIEKDQIKSICQNCQWATICCR